MCLMYCSYGFKSDQFGCPACSCLDHTMVKPCMDISWCTKSCEFGHRRDEHGCRICECLPNPCKEFVCEESEVCEGFVYKNCSTCPVTPKCIASSDVRRLYVSLQYTHDTVHQFDFEKFAGLVTSSFSNALSVEPSTIVGVRVTSDSKLKTSASFYVISDEVSLVQAADHLMTLLDEDVTSLTIVMGRLTFLPETLSIRYFSSVEVEAENVEAVESNDGKIIVASCLVGIAFLIACTVIMACIVARRKRRERKNIDYQKAPTKEMERV